MGKESNYFFHEKWYNLPGSLFPCGNVCNTFDILRNE